MANRSVAFWRRSLNQLIVPINPSITHITPKGFSELNTPFVNGLNQRFTHTDVAQPEVHTFKTETKKLLEIVTHSLYSDKEIFIRELISNASDALEKLRFLKATSQVDNMVDVDTPLQITISTNDIGRTFTIQDTGIGMTKEELIENLGTIAKSGSLAFLNEVKINNSDEANSIIGKFGVGFYSSFVVADKVEVSSKKFDDNENTKGWKWTSTGDGLFTIEEVNYIPRGTTITLYLKEECVDFCNYKTVEKFTNKFSSFVSFPLYTKEKDEVENQVNKQEALWLKEGVITQDEHTQFFRHLSGNSYSNPYYTFTFQSEIPLSIKSIFYVPEEPPSRIFQTKSEVGISLHSRRILVKKSADEIIPKWLFFIRGVVDCDDLPLNVSRESLQDTKLIENLSTAIIRRILRFLEDEAKADPEKYKKFYDGFSYYLKEGLLDETPNNKKYQDTLMKLMRFECTETNEMISFDKYLETMKPNQKNIYYFYASDRQTALASPYMEQFTQRGRNVLLLYEDIDEFVAMKLQNYKDKKFVSIDSADEDFEENLEDNEQTKNVEILSGLSDDEKTDLEQYIKGVLGEKINAIKYSDRLVSSPAIVTGFLSSSLRKMMKATMRSSSEYTAGLSNLPVTLELNPKHNIITSLYKLKNDNPTVATMVIEQLYDNASIAAGLMEDPRKMLGRLNKFVELTIDNLNKDYTHTPQTTTTHEEDESKLHTNN